MWVKELLVDFLVTIFIAAALWQSDIWMWYVIIAYTAVLLIAKGAVLSGDQFLRIVHKARPESPEWIPYVLYGINTVLLLQAQRWYLAAAWAVIGVLSWMALRKIKSRNPAGEAGR